MSLEGIARRGYGGSGRATLLAEDAHGMGAVRLFQVSDLHLGRPFGWLPRERREQRRRDQREALERCVKQAIERGAEAIVIPGDLFDQEAVDADTLATAFGAFQIPGCPPVCIAPGNHDPYFSRSYWNSRLLKARGRAWPAHVHVFRDAAWNAFALPGRDDVRLWGRCFTSGAVSNQRPLDPRMLDEIPGPRAGHVEVAVFHGSREDACPAGTDVTAPFSEAEALASPFTYLAAGHYHVRSAIAAGPGTSEGVRLAYAGSAVALDPGELGRHGALEVRIDPDHRFPRVETEFVTLDDREVHALSVDLGRCDSAEQVDRRIEKALDDARVTPQDLVTVRLAGRIAKDVRYRPAPWLLERAFHLRVDTARVRPDYDLDGYAEKDPGTTEERFAKELLERLREDPDPARRAAIESALYYGLDAFRLGEVVPAYEEME